jgi:hypothetical protein
MPGYAEHSQPALSEALEAMRDDTAEPVRPTERRKAWRAEYEAAIPPEAPEAHSQTCWCGRRLGHAQWSGSFPTAHPPWPS